jgi:hypothetical protein
MIKRTYFMTVMQYHKDGSGSFAFNSGVFTHTSWINEGNAVFKFAVEDLGKACTGKGNVQVTAFNRI